MMGLRGIHASRFWHEIMTVGKVQKLDKIKSFCLKSRGKTVDQQNCFLSLGRDSFVIAEQAHFDLDEHKLSLWWIWGLSKRLVFKAKTLFSPVPNKFFAQNAWFCQKVSSVSRRVGHVGLKITILWSIQSNSVSFLWGSPIEGRSFRDELRFVRCSIGTSLSPLVPAKCL